MSFQYLTNISLDKAIDDYIKFLTQKGFKYKTELIPVTEACQRTTSKAIYSNLSVPHYNASAMDGIAVNAEKTFGATETTPIYLNNDDFLIVDTGDPLPKDYNAVIMIEDVIYIEEKVCLYVAATPWQHIRQIGEDISAGDMIIPSFKTLTPASLGALLASNIHEIEVVEKPVVGIIPTGDEIIQPTVFPKEGDIIDFNSTIFSNIMIELGADAITYPIVKDDVLKIKEELSLAVKQCDIVLVIAGSSAGQDDYTAQVIQTLGEVLYHGLAIKPGKPTILGCINDVPVIGIPGYPVSGIIVIEKVIKPIFEEVLHTRRINRPSVKAYMARKLNSSLKYREFIRTRLGMIDKKLVAIPLNQGAGMISSFVKADGIIDVPQNREGYEPGEIVNVQLIEDIETIKSNLVITGSHDPCIDEVYDIMKRTVDGGIVSSHVGSMGGIMALKRKEAHLAGIHLLSEETGQYNVDYVKKYFPNNDVVLLEGLKRTQGFIVKKKNNNIKGIQDIIDRRLTYVNRQKGSGTRILFDCLLKQNGISLQSIKGYEREEYTHTSVAAIIASDSADVGLGIYSAAKLYDLDFIPICDDSYDFLVDKDTMELEVFQMFIDVIQGEEFRTRLESMGGYTLSNPGKIIDI